MNQTTKTCDRCGSRFSCGAEPGRPACWCAELPHVMEMPAAGDCYCPDCLRAIIDARLSQAAPRGERPTPS